MASHTRVLQRSMLVLCFVTGLSSVQTISPAGTPPPTPKAPKTYLFWATWGAALACLTRLISKDEPDKNPLTISDALKGFFNKKARRGNIVEHMGAILDQVLIGFPGKRRGLVPMGSKIVVEGQRRYATYHVYPDGEKIEFYSRNNLPPYGILGNLYAYIIPLFKALKDVKEGSDTLNYFDIGVYAPPSK